MADPKKGTGKKPKGSGRRLYTDENPRGTIKGLGFVDGAKARQSINKIKNSGKNVSLGAEKWVSIKSKDKDEKLFDYLNKIKKNGYKIVGTSTVKNNISCDITDLKLDEKLIFAFGNEEKGLSKDFIKQCDHIISIPMYGFAQSYNISVSCAIVLSNIIFKIRKSKKSIFLSKNEKEEIRNEWIKNSIKNSNLILKNIEKKRAWKDSNPRPPEP